MLADLSDALARLALTRLAPDRSHARADLDALPPLLAHALRRQLDREVRARLEAAAPWVSAVPDLWAADTPVEPRYPAAAWAETVRSTSAWLIDALVHPAETLSAAAPEHGERPADEVLDRLSDFGAYPYLGEIVEGYAAKKEMAGYSREALRDLLERVDRRVAADLDAAGWRALLAPLFDVVEALPEYADGVPGRVLAEVFAARGRPGMGAAVLSREAVARDEIDEVLAEAVASATPPPSEAPVVHRPDVETADSGREAPPAGADEREDVEDAVEIVPAPSLAPEVPLRALETEPDSAGPDDPEPDSASDEPIGDAEPDALAPLPAAPESAEPPSPVEPAEPEPAAESDDEPLWVRLARAQGGAPTPAEADAPEPLWARFTSPEPSAAQHLAGEPPADAPDLEARVLGPAASQRDLYVRELFGGDEGAYHEVLGQLAEAGSWSDASAIIGREVFRRYQVHIYSEPAASFTDAVEGQFRRHG